MNFAKLPIRPNRYKIISFGDSNSGKTCLIKRYYERRFVSKYLPTIGVDYGHTTVTLDEKEYLINVFDFSGDSMFYEVRNEFYAGTQGAILVFDVANRKSFDNLDWWLAEMCQEMEVTEYYRASIIVCANKIDSVNRQVSTLEGRTWADNLGLPYLETSASTNKGIDSLFEKLFRNMVKTDQPGRENKTSGNTNLDQSRSQSVNTDASRRVAMERLTNGKDNFEKLGLRRGATMDDVNRAYRRLAVVLHPDKNSEPGAAEVFKKLTSIRTAVLKTLAPNRP